MCALKKYWICQISGKYFRHSFSWQYRLSAIYVEFWVSWLTLCRLSLEKIPWLPRELRILIYFLSNVGPILLSWKFYAYNFIFCICYCKCRFFFLCFKFAFMINLSCMKDGDQVLYHVKRFFTEILKLCFK